MSYAKYLPYLCNANPLGRITRKFGAQGHTGVDSITFAGATDWSVCAVCPAKVEKVYTSEAVGNVVQYGYDSVKGRVTLAYYHLGKTLATAGQTVELGTKIGVMGDTGSLCRGVHLHVSMWIGGVLVDPLPYLTGAKKLPVMQQSQINNALTGAHEGEKYMIRKVTKALNLRSTRSLANNGNIVLKDMPVGTVFLVTDTVKEGGVTWGKVLVTIKGRTYAGWSNIAATWSVEV
nr:MAG TPA: peptidase [Caudoviricetes sp.]